MNKINIEFQPVALKNLSICKIFQTKFNNKFIKKIFENVLCICMLNEYF